MSKKYGLGKGLGALIPEDSSLDQGVNKISLNLIKANKEQPRKYFDDEKILILSESIKQHGIIQPLIVKKEKETYSIVAGERRWRAAKLAGLKEVPILIIDSTEREILEISLIENIQREDLNPIEEGEAYQKLLKEFSLTQEELSKRIGKSRTAISNTIRLLNLDDRVKNYLIEDIISEGHGRALLALESEEDQYLMAQKIIDENLSVRQIEKLIKVAKKNNYEEESNLNKENSDNDRNNLFYNDLEDKLENLFNTKVVINSKHKEKGKIQIEYYSESDLQRIIEILKI
ncbi:ParB/RepB/Spo0J family partition protein [Clostridium grantii]|uniref:Chromosome partitioning protein, ParB family n=1 Tax=Clostridium grantii DSM 8605 TaxID=1121316 RepID=A0A1M5XHJ8_9CLOT|nr:ParB/RepB/Spo0J family partition protein [Clostridium grantii]SHH99018.1 chromosome partitioning protein, ParB family [Clostridium grantii DSM 8605]